MVYDANGNVTSHGTQASIWDAANRLSSHGGLIYAYNGLNNRISQTVSSVVTEYLLDVQPGLTKVIGATTSGNTDRYVHAQKGIHAMEDSSGNWTHPVQDGLGSVRMELSDNLTVNGMQILSPFGGVESSVGSIGIPFGFTGEQVDGDLVYLRNRYANTALGIFPSLDPFEGLHDRPMSLNGYSWVEGRVVNATDPSGLDIGLATRLNGGNCVEQVYGTSDVSCSGESLLDCEECCFIERGTPIQACISQCMDTIPAFQPPNYRYADECRSIIDSGRGLYPSANELKTQCETTRNEAIERAGGCRIDIASYDVTPFYMFDVHHAYIIYMDGYSTTPIVYRGGTADSPGLRAYAGLDTLTAESYDYAPGIKNAHGGEGTEFSQWGLRDDNNRSRITLLAGPAACLQEDKDDGLTCLERVVEYVNSLDTNYQGWDDNCNTVARMLVVGCGLPIYHPPRGFYPGWDNLPID